MYDNIANLYVVLIKYVYGSGYRIVVLKQRYILLTYLLHGAESFLRS